MFVLSAVRTPIGRYGGGLASVPPCDLAAMVVREAVSRSGADPDQVGHSVFGNVIHTEVRTCTWPGWRPWAAACRRAVVPPRRLGELARYGMTADAWLIRRHPDDRRLATLLATARHLEAKSVDDALELLDLLMSAELLAPVIMSRPVRAGLPNRGFRPLLRLAGWVSRHLATCSSDC